MRGSLAALFLVSLSLFAGNVRVELPGGTGEPWFGLTYFNGSPHWLTWDGMYRGTWFNTEDFVPGSTAYTVDLAEYWFYENTNTYPWDTDQFYSEIWNGYKTGPEVLLVQGVVTALHYAPVYHSINPGVVTESNFWCLVNTEISAGGWPSILGDYSMPGDAGHSFYSDDFILWESWGEMGEYYIVAIWDYSLDATTWGSLKALF